VSCAQELAFDNAAKSSSSHCFVAIDLIFHPCIINNKAPFSMNIQLMKLSAAFATGTLLTVANFQIRALKSFLFNLVQTVFSLTKKIKQRKNIYI